MRTSQVTAAALRTARRFPLVLLAGAIAAVVAILMAEDPGGGGLGRTLAAASLGLSLLLAARLVGERQDTRRGWMADAAALGILALVWWRWEAWSEDMRAFRYLQLSVASHLAVAVVPFVGARLPNAFWQFNRALFERVLTALAYTLTLFLGLTLAFGAVDILLGVDLAPQAYLRLWVVLAFVFNTWVFLEGVPRHPQTLESVTTYPGGLRIFAQFVLVPLVTVYYLIFTLYVIRVLATWNWPSGWTGYLVSAMAIVGMLALLLVAPVADRPEQGWIRAFARWFWLAMLPAVVVLWLAIGQRVQQYGVTEPRYFLIVLSLWLGALALYYGITRARDYRVIPLSLALTALATMLGPWGAYRVSEASQLRRLERVLAAPDYPEVREVLRYLVRHHGTRRLAGRIPDSLVAGPANDWTESTERVTAIAVALGVPDEPGAAESRWFGGDDDPIAIGGWQRLVRITRLRTEAGGLTIIVDQSSLRVRVLADGTERLRFDLAAAAQAAWDGRADRRALIPPAHRRIAARGAEGRGLLVLTGLRIERRNGVLRLRDIDGYLLQD